MSSQTTTPPEGTPPDDPVTMLTKHLENARDGSKASLDVAQYVHAKALVAQAALGDIVAITSPQGQLIEAETKTATSLSAMGASVRDLLSRARPTAGGASAGCVLLLAGLAFVGPGPGRAEGLAMAKPRAEVAHHDRPPYKALPPTDLSAAIAAHRRKDYAAAEKLYATALDAGADRVLAITSRAECLYQLKNDAGTLAECEKLLSPQSPLFSPNCGRAMFLVHKVRERQGRTAEADEALRDAARHGDEVAQKKLSVRR